MRDTHRLHLLKKAVSSGHSISQIANIDSEELARLLKMEWSEAAKILAARKQSSGERHAFYSRSLDCVMNLETDGLESTLDQAAVHLTKSEVIRDVIEPICKEIGALSRKGDLKIVNEHMATTFIRAFLWNLLRSVEVSSGAPEIVIATPSGHRHELGVLAIGLIACGCGWRSSYFGPSLPKVIMTAKFTQRGYLWHIFDQH